MWARRDVVRLALERMDSHLAGSLHVLHASVEIGDVLLEHCVTLASEVVRHQHGDLLETHAGSLAPQDDRDAYEVVIVVQPTIGAVALRLEQPDGLPVAEHVGLEAEPGSCLSDGAKI